MLCKVNPSPMLTIHFVLIYVLHSIDAWIFERKRIHPLLLSNEEWQVLEQLCLILKVCSTQNVLTQSH
jgi:hypothetical protein